MRTHNRRSGFVMVASALSILVLLGFLGLAFDVGFLQYQKRRIQSAADAAAQGAAIQLSTNATSDTAKTEGKYDSGLNGFTDGSNGVTVTIDIPPLSGNYTAKGQTAEAIVTQGNPTYFMQFFNINSVTVAARAVATAGNSPNCVYALDPNAQDAFLASGGSTVNIGCGVVVNSSNSKGAECSGGSTRVNATNITVVGNYNASGGCSFSPTPTAGATSVTDPLAYLTTPATPATCTQTNYSWNGGTTTISPGTYCGGISVNGNATTLYLNSGLYILEGGALKVQGGANIISNSGGVTFDNTGGATIGGQTYHYTDISISGGSTTSLAAPTVSSGGAMAGILFFDRTGSNSDKEAISGGSSGGFTGTLYFPNSEVDFTGGSAGTGQWTIMVADKVNISGTSSIGRDFSNYPNGSPIKQGGLFVE